MGKTDKQDSGDTSGQPKPQRNQQGMTKYLSRQQWQSPARPPKMAPAPHGDADRGEDSEAESYAGSHADSGTEGTQSSISKNFIKKTVHQAIVKSMKAALAPVLQELAEIKADVRHIGARTERLEEALTETVSFCDTAAHHLQQHETYLDKALLMIEDQENRSRRKNIRIKGLPETYAAEALPSVTQQIFTSLLGEERAAAIVVERVHRALRPRPPPNEPPRDIVCGLLSYVDTAAVLKANREMHSLDFEGTPIKLFQDLAPSTLTKRRIMQPLLQRLREQQLPYSWLFPFGISIQKGSKRIMIRTPEDLDKSWRALGLEPIDLPSWMPVQMGQCLPALPTLGQWTTVRKSRSPRDKKKELEESHLPAREPT